MECKELLKEKKLEGFINYFTKERFLIGASLARIGFGLIILFLYAINYSQRHVLWGPNSITQPILSLKVNIFTLVDSVYYFEFIYHVGMLVTILFIVGWKGRIISLLNWILTFAIIENSLYMSDGGDNILRIILFYLLFANCTAYFSLDSEKYKEKRSHKQYTFFNKMKSILHNFAVISSIIQLCILYLTSGLYQAMGEMWSNGTAIYYILQVDEFSHPFFRDIILNSTLLVVILTYLSIIIKVSFPFLLFNKKTKYLAVLSVVIFHLGIAISMGLISFSLTLIVIEFLLITDSEYSKLHVFFSNKSGWFKTKILAFFKILGEVKLIKSQRIIVFYDGWCPFCIKSMNKVNKLDVFNLVKLVNFRNDEVTNKYDLKIEKLEKRIHSLKSNSSKLNEGIYSFIQISKRIIFLWPLLPILYISTWIGLGQRVYDYIAEKRNIIPTGKCDDQCFTNNNNNNIN